MRFDLHVHSSYSADGAVEPVEIVKLAKALGLAGISITDHNDVRAYKKARESARGAGVLLIRGTEISTSKGHILAYGLDRKIPRDMTPEDTVEKIRRMGGVAVVAHPFRMVSGVGDRITKNLKPDALECINGRSPNSDNAQVKKLARAMKLPCIGGSDSHESSSLGKAWTEFKQPPSTEDEALEAIRKGQVRPGGTGFTGPETARYVANAGLKFVKRGFKRI